MNHSHSSNSHRTNLHSLGTGIAFILAISAGLPCLQAVDDYVPGPDSKPQPGVPKGDIIQYRYEAGPQSVFPGTIRDCWLYIPKQYDASKPACVFVCQDGIQYQAPTVFDNLIHRGEMPVTIGIFVMHGRVRSGSTNALDRFNRSYEYDGLGDNYARFLIEEILPDVENRVAPDGKAIRLSKNGNDRCIAGASSGAICAFTAAWERPDAFQRVFSSVGTFVDQRGGNDYPFLIRKTEPKPLRVFLQDGSNDANGVGGNWWLANQEMLSALQFSGYAATNAWGDGGHNGKHATAVFPDAMRWIWQGWPAPVVANAEQKSKQPVVEILGADSQWALVSEGHKFTEAVTPNSRGEVFFADIPNNRIHRVNLDGTVSVFAENTGGVSGLKFDREGNLYGAAGGKKAIVVYKPDGSSDSLFTEVASNDLAVAGRIGYWTDPGNKQVWLGNDQLEKRPVDTGITNPNGVCFSPDQSLLYVSDTRGQFVYSFIIQPDGSLSQGQKYFHLRVADGDSDSGADGMTVDVQGRLYVTTRLGIQVCDQAGRVIAIIPKPHRGWLSNVCFGGPEFNDLYISIGDKVFKRKTKTTGALSFRDPIKPAPPRL